MSHTNGHQRPAPKTPVEAPIEIDFARRVVAINVKGPLDLAPQRAELPFALFKGVAGQIIAHEATGEANAGAAPNAPQAQQSRIVSP